MITDDHAAKNQNTTMNAENPTLTATSTDEELTQIDEGVYAYETPQGDTLYVTEDPRDTDFDGCKAAVVAPAGDYHIDPAGDVVWQWSNEEYVVLTGEITDYDEYEVTYIDCRTNSLIDAEANVIDLLGGLTGVSTAKARADLRDAIGAENQIEKENDMERVKEEVEELLD